MLGLWLKLVQGRLSRLACLRVRLDREGRDPDGRVCHTTDPGQHLSIQPSTQVARTRLTSLLPTSSITRSSSPYSLRSSSQVLHATNEARSVRLKTSSAACAPRK